ncbi:LOW QUALITY PROTEIN: hypothetical protein U9M48_001724 [Paspalum notatum var. saurae]|uniref:Uncharacterized protein n=1 Tax=Paspalum notatum var. saurae TaxID=547442 RepID=A0AAQ3SJ87_PASNO
MTTALYPDEGRIRCNLQCHRSRTCLTQVVATKFFMCSPPVVLRKDCIISNSSLMKTISRCRICHFSASSLMADFTLFTRVSTTVFEIPMVTSAIDALSVSPLLLFVQAKTGCACRRSEIVRGLG